MNTDKERNRSELDKMVEAILAGTKPSDSDEKLPGSETVGEDTADEEVFVPEDAPDDVPVPPVSYEEADGSAGISETGESSGLDSDLSGKIAAAIAEIRIERQKKAGLAQKADAPAVIPDKPEKAENAVKTENIVKAEKPAKSEKSAEKAKKSKKPKAPEQKPLKPLFRIANIIYSSVIFAGMAVAFILLPRGDVSVIEQRTLATMPSFTPESAVNGGYTNGITEYFNDNVPYRDELKKIGAQMSNLFGVSFGGANISGPVAVLTETEHIETTKNVNEIAPGVVTNGQVVTQLNDGHWWGISLFGGGKGTKYAACVNKFKELLGDSVNVYSMTIPTSGEYYLPSGYEQYNASHQKSIDSIDEQLMNVVSVPASMEFWKHVNEPIYTRTDHHWQPLGAYYAAQTFAKAADVPFADISTMEKVDVPGYVGTMYSFTNDAHILNDPEVFTYYKPTNSYTTYYYNTSYKYDYTLPFFVPMPTGSSYSTFMGGDAKIVRIKTDVDNGRKLVVFKDSYGNAEIPFYFGSFEEIWVCDMRYFDLNAIEFIKFTGATDLLFTMCTFSAVGSNAKGLENVLNNPVTEIKEGAPG